MLQKTRVPGLSCDVVCVILHFTISRFSRTLTSDGRTQGHGYYRGCIASCGKNSLTHGISNGIKQDMKFGLTHRHMQTGMNGKSNVLGGKQLVQVCPQK